MEIIRTLRPQHDVVNGVAITASTGIVALKIGGITLHSFAGIRLGNKPVKELLEVIRKFIKLFRRWNTTRVLIIDESVFYFFGLHVTALRVLICLHCLVSMIHGTLFRKLVS